ncbi:hypothetical protein P7C73_g4024, partial [Tremellales sp. Uapishka_1]
MTTSITVSPSDYSLRQDLTIKQDARFTSIHFTPGHLLSLSFDEPPETGWSVMPGFDESLPIPPHLEPPRLDADETLPSHLHPSYPFGRPISLGTARLGISSNGISSNIGNLLGTVGNGNGEGNFGSASVRWGRGEIWDELGIDDVVEKEKIKEVPPGMAGAKRPPTPPSPALRPLDRLEPRSEHLRNLLHRQRAHTPTAPGDPFDAPVPNETFEDGDGDATAYWPLFLIGSMAELGCFFLLHPDLFTLIVCLKTSLLTVIWTGKRADGTYVSVHTSPSPSKLTPTFSRPQLAVGLNAGNGQSSRGRRPDPDSDDGEQKRRWDDHLRSFGYRSSIAREEMIHALKKKEPAKRKKQLDAWTKNLSSSQIGHINDEFRRIGEERAASESGGTGGSQNKEELSAQYIDLLERYFRDKPKAYEKLMERLAECKKSSDVATLIKKVKDSSNRKAYIERWER